MIQEDFFRPRHDLQALRPYQQQALAGVKERLAESRSTLVVMPTGTGKTRLFTELIREWPFLPDATNPRTLVLAHRDELLGQAKKRIEAETGESVGLEQAAFYAGNERIVVASIQTLSQPRRLARWEADTFGLVICDEAHHAVSKSWRKVLDHFGGAKVLGVTATPDRADEQAMGQVFDSVAFVYEIDDAIRDGWLAPIQVVPVYIDSIDFSRCKKVAGDLSTDDLERVIAQEETLHGIAKATVEQSGGRRTLMFTPGVESAHKLADIMSRYQPGFARAIDGGMDFGERRRILAAHQRGEFPCLTNCAIATEGYDDPRIEVVSMARPTMSRSLYAQMIGRGLRPGKPCCTVIEFTGNSGKHHLACATDVLGGKYDDDVVEAAAKKVASGKVQNPTQALEQAKAEAEAVRLAQAAARSRITADVRYRTGRIDPFAVLHLEAPDDAWAKRFGGKPASEKQVAALRKWGLDVPDNLMAAAASKLLGTCIMRRQKGLATYKQVRTLEKHGVQALNWTFAHASETIDAIVRNGWRLPAGMATTQRQPGE